LLAVALVLAAAAHSFASEDATKPIPVPALRTKFAALPGVSQLPAQAELPPVLVSQAGKPVGAKEWPARRAEMRRILEHYFVGHMPPAPGNVQSKVVETRKLANGNQYRLVRLTFGPKSALNLDIGVFTPPGNGPFPVVIAPAGAPPGAAILPRLALGPGQGKGVDALLSTGPGPTPTLPPVPPAADAEAIARESAVGRGFAYVMFDNNDCGEDTTLREADGSWAFRRTRFFPAYPGYDWGLLGAWAWGASRVVDYVQTDPTLDKKKIALTGFSRTGKSALIAGAFDERIALTAPVATGGGGIGAFRHTGPGRGGKEGLDLMLKKYPNWFSPELYPFAGNTERLPFDQHWLIALIAPRAFIALESVADPVSLASGVRESFSGAAPAYALLGATKQLGVHYAAREHAFSTEDWSALLDFAERELVGAPARRLDRFPPESFAAANDAGQAPQRVVLWNGKDLKGWSAYLGDAKLDPKSAVSIKDGVLKLASPAKGYIKTERSFSDYHLHVEWRWPKDSPWDANSGVMLHVQGPDAIWPLCFEAQLKTSNAGQVVGMGLDIPPAPLLNNRKRAPRLAEPSEVPLGDWNSYEIYARGNTIEAYVNGVRQNFVHTLPQASGQIALQVEGFPIEFRNVWLEPLVKQTGK
jgi:hypothetical protein